MSKTTQRTIIQFVALALLLVGGYVAFGWVGSLAGFGLFIVAIVIETSLRLRRANGTVVSAAQAASTPREVLVRGPQDYKGKGGKSRR